MKYIGIIIVPIFYQQIFKYIFVFCNLKQSVIFDSFIVLLTDNHGWIRVVCSLTALTVKAYMYIYSRLTIDYNVA